MRFKNASASLFIPDGKACAEALTRVTHLGVGAHQDDLEIMAFHGIRRCYENPDEWFGGVVCTDGAGSPRAGRYAECSEDKMRRLRADEQVEAARVGRYGFVVQLGYTSDEVRQPDCPDLTNDLLAILSATRPRIVYTHNPADLHDTHVSVSLKAIEVIRRLPDDARPEALYGCEVWRGLDWLGEEDKVALDVGAADDLAKRLIALFQSQNAAGKDYLEATIGRRTANATFYQPYEVDKYDGVVFAMDLTPLVRDVERDISRYVLEYVDELRRNVESTIRKFL
jgi:LmbE family N-acetylglucosaminyl deacetylase